MKGLIIKDFKLILQNKFIIALMILFSILGLTVGIDHYFMVAYFTLCCTGLAISTSGYDEKNNTISYLITMPVSRRGYVIEKYIFTSTIGFIGYALSVSICLFSCLIRKQVFDYTALSFAAFLFLLPAFMIPINLIFGTTKGRVVSLALAGIISFLIAVCVPPLLMITSVVYITTDGELELQGISEMVSFTPQVYVVLILVILGLLAFYGLSMLLSLKIIKKKNY